MKHKIRKKDKLSDTLDFLLMTASIALIVALVTIPMRQQKGIQEISQNFNITRHSPEVLEANESIEVTFDESDISPLNEETIEEARQYVEEHEMPLTGGITIPEIGLNLPIFNGLTDAHVTYGAATLKENQVMGERNYVLASHHAFDTFANGFDASQLLFSPLEHAKEGMLVHITNKQKIYTYKIFSKTEVAPNQTEVIDDIPGRNILTLITCTDAQATNRIVVQAELLETSDYQTNKTIAKEFEKPVNSY